MTRNSEYQDEIYRQWLMAENATNGFMLNKAGQRAANVAAFQRKQAETAKHQADLAAKKATKEAEAKKKADAAAAAAAASAAASAPKQ